MSKASRLLSLTKSSKINLISTSSILHQQTRSIATAQAQVQKRAGDISDAFTSLSGGAATPLEPRFTQVKKSLIAGNEEAVNESWNRLLQHLRKEVAAVSSLGSRIVPEISYTDIKNGTATPAFAAAYKERGACVVRGVVSSDEALQYKSSILEYVRQNPHTKAFPAGNPQVYELYWSEAQLRARSHPNLLETQKFLMSFWHAAPEVPISTRHSVSYADRLRIRQPGDATFALGPHIDGGSLERWEPNGYALGGGGKGVYGSIFSGEWEKYDAWNATARLGAVSDLYGGVGACGIFRMSQGWLSMSDIQAGSGHLLVNPMLKAATAYILLRPFFEPKRAMDGIDLEQYLRPENWRMETETTTQIQGATPGHGQELTTILHPHLCLENSMVHIPTVAPGDFVSWHCDQIHAVDKTNLGTTDSSVLYIPVCPLTVDNAEYLRRQRETFLSGAPSPDFGGGEGESQHVGRVTADDVPALMGKEGLRAMGMLQWDSTSPDLAQGEREVMDRANQELGFHV